MMTQTCSVVSISDYHECIIDLGMRSLTVLQQDESTVAQRPLS